MEEELVQLLNSLTAKKAELLKRAARDASEALYLGEKGQKLLEVLEMAWKKS